VDSTVHWLVACANAGPVTPHVAVSLAHLKAAAANGDTDALIRYVRLHVGDGDETAGRKEIDKAWVQALLPLLDVPDVDRQFVLDTLQTRDRATLAHLFFSLHFHLVKQSGEWIHDGDL
jgi:hypothetical protein